MSSDGATDKPRPARPGRGDDRGLASVALGALLVLAVVATVVMVFSDNPVWMRIGTLAALWAAFIGAFLVARYRRQAAAEAARVRDLHTVYELQLEREISARREHELVVEKELREAVRLESSDSLRALRQEIAALREQLGALGVTLPEDRYAVAGLAPAGELGVGPLPSVPSERVEPRRRGPVASERPDPTVARPFTTSSSSSPSSSSKVSTPAPSTPGPSTSTAPTPSEPATPVSGVGPDATPSTERTEKFSPVSEPRAWSQETTDAPRRPAVRPVSDSARPSWRPAESATSSAPTRTPDPTPAAPTRTPDPTPAAPSATGSSAPRTRPARAAEAQKTEAETPPGSQGRHGQGAGLTVAELMAKLGGDDAPSGGRRRHRAED